MDADTQGRLSITLAQQAGRLLQSGRFDAARNVVAALRHSVPQSTDADEIEARLCIAEGRSLEAIGLLDAAVDRAPASPSLRLLRAEARSRLDDPVGAAADAAEATILAPHDTRAKAMLGLIMIELDRLEDATACLRDAVQKTPTLGAAWRGLAEVMTRLGDAAAADVVYDAGIANVPHDPRLRLAAMMAAIREQNFTRVAAIGLSARRDGLADACIFGLLGHSLSKLDRHGEAADYYQDALRLAPEDPYVRHLVRAAGLLPGVDRAPLRYVEAVFDGYAANFDQHLMSLGYRVPGQIRDILSGLIEDSEVATLGEVLDLGCGTGLVGLLVSDLPMTSLTGVDISENMVEKARSKQVYGEIFISDLVPFLDQDGSRWDCILGGDVFCYFGVLDLVFESIWRALRPGGLFVCNVEAAGPTSDVGWRLESQGRYVHRADYVRSCLLRAGFTVSEFSSQTLRFEGGAPVDGLYVMARKNGHNA